MIQRKETDFTNKACKSEKGRGCRRGVQCRSTTGKNCEVGFFGSSGVGPC